MPLTRGKCFELARSLTGMKRWSKGKGDRGDKKLAVTVARARCGIKPSRRRSRGKEWKSGIGITIVKSNPSVCMSSCLGLYNCTVSPSPSL